MGQHMLYDLAQGNPGFRASARQRWTPSQTQLQILESLFEQGHATPSKQKIKEITMELSQHGQISETNVYNWFQNRKARAKRKQLPSQRGGESENETDDEYPGKKKKDLNLNVIQMHRIQNQGTLRRIHRLLIKVMTWFNTGHVLLTKNNLEFKIMIPHLYYHVKMKRGLMPHLVAL
jgi:hypothetical protein